MADSRLSAQLVEQHLGVLEVGGLEALGEPVVDRREQVVGLPSVAAVGVEPGEITGGAKLEYTRGTLARIRKGRLESRLYSATRSPVAGKGRSGTETVEFGSAKMLTPGLGLARASRRAFDASSGSPRCNQASASIIRK